ncbi:hypothetical protein DPMN_155135 [Dreissena polymorpha]|uniref:Uncharacterized protein n=1 Tax=Dreissena polymorpha TaxID=45954 RepID=A0A9D4J9R3_DREPO|nr:hypothetical protein DPMN_155135 [Dreissena polymorpha]
MSSIIAAPTQAPSGFWMLSPVTVHHEAFPVSYMGSMPAEPTQAPRGSCMFPSVTALDVAFMVSYMSYVSP